MALATLVVILYHLLHTSKLDQQGALPASVSCIDTTYSVLVGPDLALCVAMP